MSFELIILRWAWQNPHVTQHIAAEDRIQHAAGKKRSGQPKRPRHTVSSLISNLHVLLRSPSFFRWPLEIRFFSKTVYHAWVRWTTKIAQEPIRSSINIIKDFSIDKDASSDVEDPENGTVSGEIYRRMAHLPINYTNHKPHVEKVIDLVREGNCKLCKKTLEHDGGLYIICPTAGCETVTHMSCLSKHFMDDGSEDLVPINGTCPGCHTHLVWSDIVKELSLRMRGQKEVQKLLKVKRARKTKESTLSQPIIEASEEEEEDLDLDDDEADANRPMHEFASQQTDPGLGDSWHIPDDLDFSDAESVVSAAATSSQLDVIAASRIAKVPTITRIVEDSDWDEAEILD